MINLSDIDYIIYDLFGGSPQETIKKMSPYRNTTVADQLISTRHMWSDTFNRISSDYSELENYIQIIFSKIYRQNPSYAENEKTNALPYEKRPFFYGSFISFLSYGRFVYQSKLMDVEKVYRFQRMSEEEEEVEQEYIQQEEAEAEVIEIDKYPAHYTYNLKGSLIKNINIKDFNDVLEKNKIVISDIEFQQATEDIANGFTIQVPLVITEAGRLIEIRHASNSFAAETYNIKKIPVIFYDTLGKVNSVSVLKQKKFVVDVKIKSKPLFAEETILYDGSQSMILGAYHGKNVKIEDLKLENKMIEIIKSCAKNGIYYEGSAIEPVVLNFIKKYNIPAKKTKSWEPTGIKLKPKELLLLDLFGGEFSDLKNAFSKIVKTHKLKEVLLNNQSNWSMQVISEKDLADIFTLAGFDIKLLDQIYDANKFKKLHRQAQIIAFNEDGKNSKHPLHLLEIAANSPRTASLIKSWKNKPGLFFAGASHITENYIENYAKFKIPGSWQKNKL